MHKCTVFCGFLKNVFIFTCIIEFIRLADLKIIYRSLRLLTD